MNDRKPIKGISGFEGAIHNICKFVFLKDLFSPALPLQKKIEIQSMCIYSRHPDVSHVMGVLIALILHMVPE